MLFLSLTKRLKGPLLGLERISFFIKQYYDSAVWHLFVIYQLQVRVLLCVLFLISTQSICLIHIMNVDASV